MEDQVCGVFINEGWVKTCVALIRLTQYRQKKYCDNCLLDLQQLKISR